MARIQTFFVYVSTKTNRDQMIYFCETHNETEAREAARQIIETGDRALISTENKLTPFAI
jgi:hypothetical protein